MASYPTPDIVTALAPDAASLKAGRGLASPGKWLVAAGNAEVLWGLMQGSGKDPYQVQALADGSATKCSCPSRKFPCKHALGLLFIAAEQPGKLASPPVPGWVLEWLAGRAEKAGRAEAKAAAAAAAPGEGGEPAKGPADEKAQAKRREKRSGRVAEGMGFLRQWLADLVRQGLADAPIRDFGYWETAARRMIDAQAPGLARVLRQCGQDAARGVSGQASLLDRLGRLHLLLAAADQPFPDDPSLRAEVDQWLGYTVPQETVLAGAEVTDRWFVAGRTVEEEDRIITVLTWFRGARSGRWACWIQSAPAQQPVFTPMPLGRWLEGSLCFYPGVQPVRAVWKNPPMVVDGGGEILTESVEAMLARYAALQAENPWRVQMPFCISAVAAESAGQACLVEAEGAALPLAASPALTHSMMAVDGGCPAAVCGLWDGGRVLPLAMADHGAWMSLTGKAAP